MVNRTNPFRLTLTPRWLASGIEKTLSLDVLADHYDQRPNADAGPPSRHVDAFLDYTLMALSAKLTLNNPQALNDIPATGPTLLVANHPLGGLEGVAMTRMLRQIRPDVKVLTNELLARIPEFSEIFIGVDVLSKNAAKKNAQGMRKVARHLAAGGALLIYPAGMVSTLRADKRRIEDREWSNVIGKLAQRFQATCVPFFVHGRNSPLFYLAGLIHPRLRTAMLARELTNKAGKDVSLTIGSPILWRDIQALDGPDSIAAYLRTATYLLSHSQRTTAYSSAVHPPLEYPQRNENQRQQLHRDLAKIKPFRLLQYREFDLYCAPYEQLGSIMEEIAIARERTFRAAGEGTGLSSDSDQYDPHYLHLFIWDTAKSAIVGGYRVARADEIVEKFGVDGLYSRSLYKFDAQYIRRIGGALEVGRSFVSLEYQRHPRALDLLWQGIGSWVVQNPGYHTLFGCVSISREHSSRARAFLNETLMQRYCAEQAFLNDVRPVAPLKVKDRVWNDSVLSSLSNITLINKLLGQCDPGKNIPILLRQYIALNGKFLGFSVNHSFNDSLDGLIMVDLRKTPIKYLQRYLGKAGSEIFIQSWSMHSDAA